MSNPIGSIRRIARRLATRRIHRIASRQVAGIAGATSLRLLDIGGAGGPKSRWSVARAHVDITIVEPDIHVGQAAIASTSGYHSVALLATALAKDSGARTLYVCKHPRQSSLLEPSADFLANYHDGHKWQVARTMDVAATALDAISSPGSFDFIKLDTQGSELEILQGAMNTLAGVIGVEVEVEFREVYRHQPLFGSVSTHLTSAGFDFIDFVALARWQRSDSNGLRTHLGELIHADALFLRSPKWVVNHADSPDIVRRALLIYFLYGQFDLMRVVLHDLHRTGSPLHGQVELAEIVDRLHARRVRRQRQARAIAAAVRWLEPELDLHLLP